MPDQTGPPLLSRRRLLHHFGYGVAAVAASGWFAPGVFAEELVRTPRQTEGPFFPDKLPLDTDNDLLVVNNSITPAVGEVTHLDGRILDARGEPVRNALVEIWQVDNQGAYLHSGSDNREKRDANFQGYGRFLTGSSGEYYFRTIKPVAYPGRTPHIHVAVNVKGREKFTTQCYIKGHPQNARDGILRSIRDERARAIRSPSTSPRSRTRASTSSPPRSTSSSASRPRRNARRPPGGVNHSGTRSAPPGSASRG